MLRDRLTMVIHTCDKFSDLWDAHVLLLNKNWANRDIDTYLVSDKETSRNFDGVKVLSAGDGAELPQRTKYVLDYIKTDYVLITLDDYFPIYQIDSSRIERLIGIMDKERLDYIRMYVSTNSNKKYKSYDGLYEIDMSREYAVNLYQGIWRKSFLEKTIKDSVNAWQYEVSLTATARECNAKCVMSKGKEFEMLDVVRKGKILHKANRYLKKHDLYHGDREVISYKDEFRIFVWHTGKKILPRGLAIKVKNLLRKRGYTFYSDGV